MMNMMTTTSYLRSVRKLILWHVHETDECLSFVSWKVLVRDEAHPRLGITNDVHRMCVDEGVVERGGSGGGSIFLCATRAPPATTNATATATSSFTALALKPRLYFVIQLLQKCVRDRDKDVDIDSR
jgi:hypothetical protein